MLNLPTYRALEAKYDCGIPADDLAAAMQAPMDPATGTALSLYNHHANVCRERLLKLRKTTDAGWRASYIDDMQFAGRQCRNLLPRVAPVLLEAIRMGRAASVAGRAAE